MDCTLWALVNHGRLNGADEGPGLSDGSEPLVGGRTVAGPVAEACGPIIGDLDENGPVQSPNAELGVVGDRPRFSGS